MGSPDPHGRQLDGMGGGVSSLSKVCVVGPPTRDDADVDYTFAQVQITKAMVDYAGNCGNMSSAIGPFAVDEGLVQVARDGEAVVRIHNTNTSKIIRSNFQVVHGTSAGDGDLVIPGVAGSGAPVRLDFLDPGGASTGKLLPSGQVCDWLEPAGGPPIVVSMVDAANACVFVAAVDLGLSGIELPDELAARPDILLRLEAIRASAAVAMGLAVSIEQAHGQPFIPLIGIVAPPQWSSTLSGDEISADAADLVVRMMSSGQPHRALPLTGSLCTAVAALIGGTVVERARRAAGAGSLRLAMPSGVLVVDAAVERDHLTSWRALHGSFFRTTRRLFEGFVHVREI